MKNIIYKYCKISISEKSMSRFMYALLMTSSKLVNSHHLSLEKFSRKKNSGNLVDVVIEINSDKIYMFEKLAEIKLKDSIQFQGKMDI